MVEEIDVENYWISNFQGLVTLNLTLDQVIWHTVMHQSLTSTHTPTFIQIEWTLWTDTCKDGLWRRRYLFDLRPALLYCCYKQVNPNTHCFTGYFPGRPGLWCWLLKRVSLGWDGPLLTQLSKHWMINYCRPTNSVIVSVCWRQMINK